MNIGEIDKDFVDLIHYLDEKGFRPFSSCDGVEANHKDGYLPSVAYIAFLESPRIIDLMAAFFRDKETFGVSLSNESETGQTELYGNILEGNRYIVSFPNLTGDMTSYFEKIIRGVVDEKITISGEEKRVLEQFDQVLADDKQSNLNIDISFHRSYQPYMKKEGRTNVITVTTKEGELYGLDFPQKEGFTYCMNMNHMLDLLNQKFGITKKQFSLTDDFKEDEFSVCMGESTCEIYYSEDKIDEMIRHIQYMRQIEEQLPIFEVKDIDWDEIEQELVGEYRDDEGEPEI